jgi:hypothetical protein
LSRIGDFSGAGRFCRAGRLSCAGRLSGAGGLKKSAVPSRAAQRKKKISGPFKESRALKKFQKLFLGGKS